MILIFNLFMSLFTNILLCLSLACLIVKSKFRLKFSLFDKEQKERI